MEMKTTQSCLTLWPHGWAHQAPPSMEFSIREFWNGVPFHASGDLPTQGSDLHLLRFLHWQMDSSSLAPDGKPLHRWSHSSFFRPLDVIAGVTRCRLFFSKVEENSGELVIWRKEKFRYKTTQIYIIQFWVPWLLWLFMTQWFDSKIVGLNAFECQDTTTIRPDFTNFKFNTWLVIRKMERLTCCVVKSTCHIIVTICNLRSRTEF